MTDEAHLLDTPFALDLNSFAAGDSAHIGGNGESWFVPLTGSGALDDQHWEAGQCWLIGGSAHLACAQDTRALIATT